MTPAELAQECAEKAAELIIEDENAIILEEIEGDFLRGHQIHSDHAAFNRIITHAFTPLLARLEAAERENHRVAGIIDRQCEDIQSCAKLGEVAIKERDAALQRATEAEAKLAAQTSFAVDLLDHTESIEKELLSANRALKEIEDKFYCSECGGDGQIPGDGSDVICPKCKGYADIEAKLAAQERELMALRELEKTCRIWVNETGTMIPSHATDFLYALDAIRAAQESGDA